MKPEAVRSKRESERQRRLSDHGLGVRLTYRAPEGASGQRPETAVAIGHVCDEPVN